MRLMFDAGGPSHPQTTAKPLATASPRRKNHPAGKYLHLRGATHPGVYRIQRGIVSLEEVNEDGNRCILQFLGPGALLDGEMLWQSAREFDARACTRVEVERCDSDEQLREPAFRLSVAQAMAQQGQRMAQLKAALHQANADQRVLHLLSTLKALPAASGQAIWLPTRTEMADFLDLNHATVSRVIARLRRNGVIQLVGTHSALVAWERLPQACLRH